MDRNTKDEKKVEYENIGGLLPSKDTLANDDDTHKGVICARSIFFKTSNFEKNYGYFLKKTMDIF